jgi:hypothetical protein
MPDSSERRFTQQEFAQILRKAAELQESVIPARAEGFSLDEMEHIAAEAGIPAEHVRRAVALLDQPQLTLGERFLGGPANFRFEHEIAGNLGERTLQLMVDEARRALGKQGEVRLVLDELEWEHKDEMSGVHLNIARRAEHTRVQLIAHFDHGYVLMVLTPVVSLLVGGVAGVVLGLDSLPEIAAAASTALGAGILGMRAVWRRTTRRWRARLENLLGRVLDSTRVTDRHPR